MQQTTTIDISKRHPPTNKIDSSKSQILTIFIHISPALHYSSIFYSNKYNKYTKAKHSQRNLFIHYLIYYFV